MDRTRIMLATFVDLDPVPGTFHTADSARSVVGNILKQSIGHYSPVVGIVSYGRTFYDLEFNSNSKQWHPVIDYNVLFVKATLNYLNDRLAAQGYLFLNDVYGEFGLPKTREGQIVGWTDGPIPWDWKPIDDEPNIRITFHTEGSIIDKAFEADRSYDYVAPKNEEEMEES